MARVCFLLTDERGQQTLPLISGEQTPITLRLLFSNYQTLKECVHQKLGVGLFPDILLNMYPTWESILPEIVGGKKMIAVIAQPEQMKSKEVQLFKTELGEFINTPVLFRIRNPR